MGIWLSEREQRLVAGAEEASAATPIPTQIVSNGEYLPPRQSATQKKVERRIVELADANAKRLGLNRRQFMRTSCGMAAAFVAMNEIYGGNVFQVTPAEAADPELAQARAHGLAGQFIFDVQTHFVRDDFDHKQLLGLAEFASQHWNPKMKAEGVASLARYKFQNYVKEVFYDSDTSLALLSGGAVRRSDPVVPVQRADGRGARADQRLRGLAAAAWRTRLITPNQPGWMDEVDKAITVHKPDSWKGYTIGDPLNPSKFPWRLDDEKLMYPFYDKAVKSGITTICIHKGLLPPDYEKASAGVWSMRRGRHRQGGQGLARTMNSRDHHAGLSAGLRIAAAPVVDGVRADRPHPRWASDLADIPRSRCQQKRTLPGRARHGVRQLGGVRIPSPARPAGRTLVKGMGADHVLVGHRFGPWYGSPQAVSRRCAAWKSPRTSQEVRVRGTGDANSMTKQMIFAHT